MISYVAMVSICKMTPNSLLFFISVSLGRFYLIAGGVPLIICGITAAVNINNYGDNIP